MLLALQYKLCQRTAMRGNMIYGNELTCVAIQSLATNKITLQMVLLPRQSGRDNNVWSLATNKITWQMVYLPRHGSRGNNTLCNKILAWQYRLLQQRCSCQMYHLLLRRWAWQVLILPRPWTLRQHPIAMLGNGHIWLQETRTLATSN
jgi:hypothetical protein